MQLDPFDEIRAQCEPDGADSAPGESALVSILFQKVCIDLLAATCLRSATRLSHPPFLWSIPSRHTDVCLVACIDVQLAASVLTDATYSQVLGVRLLACDGCLRLGECRLTDVRFADAPWYGMCAWCSNST